MQLSLDTIASIASIVGIGIAIIWTVWRMTRDVRTNFKDKVNVDTCKILHKNLDTTMDNLKDHLDKRFEDLKEIIKANNAC